MSHSRSRASKSGVIADTVSALLDPRRLVPILLVCGPMVWIQRAYSTDPLAVPLAVLTCVAFVVIAPTSWRALFPADTASITLLKLVVYAVIGLVVVAILGVLLPRFLGMGTTFLTTGNTLLVTLALFWVGGWGLGRDIGFEARTQALAREAEQAQLLALRSHLDPHFLFNTLNAIAEWCREDGEVAERAVLQLSDMLRTVLAGARAPHWPLSQELELVRTLFALHLLRDPKWFELQLECPEPLREVAVPPLLLLPLAENAVKHGPAAGHRGLVKLEVEAVERSARVTLTNPGVYRGPRPGSEGVPTVTRRLALAYGGRASLRIGPTSNGTGTRVEVVLPQDGPDSGVNT